MESKAKVKSSKPKKVAPKKDAEVKTTKSKPVSSRMAVIRIAGRQYKVLEGSEVLVDKLESDKAKLEVMLVATDSDIKVGKPTVDGASVKYSIVKDLEKGEKVKGFKYKAKSRYRKRFGFRKSYTRIAIEKVNI